MSDLHGVVWTWKGAGTHGSCKVQESSQGKGEDMLGTFQRTFPDVQVRVRPRPTPSFAWQEAPSMLLQLCSLFISVPLISSDSLIGGADLLPAKAVQALHTWCAVCVQ